MKKSKEIIWFKTKKSKEIIWFKTNFLNINYSLIPLNTDCSDLTDF